MIKRKRENYANVRNIKEENSKIELIIFSINKIKIIQDKLELLYSEYRLQGWERH